METTGRYRVGLDVGGTFVDIIAFDEKGVVQATKVPTRPEVFAALEEGLRDLGLGLDQIDLLVHGTTVATNALVQKRGAHTLLLTTKGFRDILEIRRTNRGDLFNLNWSPPRPIIERANRLEIDERVAWTGKVLRPVDLSDIDRILRIIDKREIEAVAIVFLHAYINPIHERQARDVLLKHRPGLHVSISSEVIPSYREFERTSTTAANAYIAPILASYVERFAEDLKRAGFVHELLIMQSNGGLSSVKSSKDEPVKTVRSGPAGGAVGLRAESRRSEQPHMIGLDIGGTSADVSMIWQHELKWRTKMEVEFGLPIAFPAIDIVSIGAGGGTIAWIDKGGRLRAGPMSAGADPGPACYGLGGGQPTSTDAEVVLGRVSARNFLGGRMVIYPELSERSVAERIAGPLRLSLPEAAIGIIDILTNNMIQSVRLVTIERGYDPRDFVLCAFGGGGGLFAADIARELSIPRVLVPTRPGLFSAYGILMADMAHDVSQTFLTRVDHATIDDVESSFGQLEAKVLNLFESDGVHALDVKLQRVADLLYEGQTHAVSVPISSREEFTVRVRERMLATFHQEFARRFGHSDSSFPVEFMNLRVFARHALPGGSSPLEDVSQGSNRVKELKPKERRDVYFSEANGYVNTPIYDRDALPEGAKLDGPIVVEQPDTTTLVPSGMIAEVQPKSRNILIHTHS